MKNVLIISNSRLDRDPRIQRQIDALEGNYSVETLGVSDSKRKKIKHFELKEKGVKALFLYIVMGISNSQSNHTDHSLV